MSHVYHCIVLFSQQAEIMNNNYILVRIKYIYRMYFNNNKKSTHKTFRALSVV